MLLGAGSDRLASEDRAAAVPLQLQHGSYVGMGPSAGPRWVEGSPRIGVLVCGWGSKNINRGTLVILKYFMSDII